MTGDALDLDAGLWGDCQGGLHTDPLLTVPEWADRYRVLSSSTASEAGRYRSSRTPYLVKIGEALSATSPAEMVVLMKGSQIGATELGLNWIGYVIHQAPGPFLFVSPTVEMAKRTSKQRLDALIEDCPELRALVKDPRSRDSGNTILLKEFPRGVLINTGANSGVGMRSMPARYVYGDEVEAYPPSADDEGDPVALAMRATRTFQRRKMYFCSTPLRAGMSRIERLLNACESRWRWHVPCPTCAAMQVLELANLHWPEGEPAAAHFVCVECAAPIEERDKTAMLARGEWRADWNRGTKSIGFHLPAFYSPIGWFSWADAARLYEQAKTEPELLPVFRNTVEGLPHQERHEAPDWHRLYDRRESYPIGVVPPGVLFLTAAVDVQGNRLEWELKGWGRGKESWSIDYRVCEGDTARPEVWAALDQLLLADWPRHDGATMPIRVLCVDSGFATQHVYTWARRWPQPWWGPAGASARQPRTVAAVKGVDRGVALLAGATKLDAGTAKRGLRVWSIGTPLAKSELYTWLRLERLTEEEHAAGRRFPPGYVHVPEYGEDYFKQLTAERRVIRLHKGFPRSSWEKDPGVRNEALDLAVYNRAAAALVGIDRFTEHDWTALERVYGAAGEPPAPPPSAPPRDRNEPGSMAAPSRLLPARPGRRLFGR